MYKVLNLITIFSLQFEFYVQKRFITVSACELYKRSQLNEHVINYKVESFH